MVARLACTTAVILLMATPSGLARSQPVQDLVHRQVYLMGTLVTLATYDADRIRALGRLEAFVASLEATEAELSTWRQGTLFGSLNEQPVGKPAELSAAFCRLLDELGHWQRETMGSFDPAVGALTAAYGLRHQGRIPTAGELRSARARSGWSHLELDTTRCHLVRNTDVVLEEGGFGKGEALDRLQAVADRVGPDAPWQVDLGGQLIVHGRPPHSDAWPVALSRPDRRDVAAFELPLTQGSLSTSGGSERDRFVNGRRISHIIDPRTGEPARFGGSVTVWHERALVADILSTALVVMGPEEGLRWANARGIAACFLEVRPTGNGNLQMRTSEAWARRWGLIPVSTS